MFSFFSGIRRLYSSSRVAGFENAHGGKSIMTCLRNGVVRVRIIHNWCDAKGPVRKDAMQVIMNKRPERKEQNEKKKLT